MALSPRRIFQRRKGEPATKEAILDTHRCESYVYAQMIAGRDATVHIDIKNPDRRCTGVHALSVNGQAVRGNRIPMDLLKSGEILRVEAVLSGKT